MKYLTKLFFLLIISCNSKSQIKNTHNFEITISDEVSKMKKYNRYDTINFNTISQIYKKKDTTYYVEKIVKISDPDNFFIYLNSSHSTNNYSVIDRRFEFYFDKEMNSLLFLFNHSEASDAETNEFYKVIDNDTLFLQNDKIYFWKNKTPSKNEILAKESEILAIKREIDSVLNE